MWSLILRRRQINWLYIYIYVLHLRMQLWFPFNKNFSHSIYIHLIYTLKYPVYNKVFASFFSKLIQYSVRNIFFQKSQLFQIKRHQSAVLSVVYLVCVYSFLWDRSRQMRKQCGLKSQLCQLKLRKKSKAIQLLWKDHNCRFDWEILFNTIQMYINITYTWLYKEDKIGVMNKK